MLALVLLGFALEALSESVADFGFTRIDTRRSRLELAPGAVDPRWEEWLSGRLAAFGSVSTLDDEGLEALTASIAAAPFVAEVGRPSVLWPDGLSLELRLRQPVACIARGHDYLLVSHDGTILPGLWQGPPALEHDGTRCVLPVLGPLDTAFEHVQPGDFLTEPRHLDALRVAVSMERLLAATDRATLGPIVIDAERARQASVEEAGVRLWLEDRRLVLFGRAPWSEAPGELPAERKWASLSAGLERLRRGDPQLDWELLDVRWDRPTLRPRGALLAGPESRGR